MQSYNSHQLRQETGYRKKKMWCSSMIWRRIFQPVQREDRLIRVGRAAAAWLWGGARWQSLPFPAVFLTTGLLMCFYKKCILLYIYFNFFFFFFLAELLPCPQRSFITTLKILFFALTDRYHKLSINSGSQLQIHVCCRFIIHHWSPLMEQIHLILEYSHWIRSKPHCRLPLRSDMWIPILADC